MADVLDEVFPALKTSRIYIYKYYCQTAGHDRERILRERQMSASSSSSAQTSETQLPACKRCRASKKRCDRAAPKCSHCTRASTACTVIDPITAKTYSREYIGQLENREAELLRRRINFSGENRAGVANIGSTNTASEYVGETGGLSAHLRNILFDPELGIPPARMSRYNSPDRAIRNEETSHANHEPPTIEQGSALIENYFRRFHVHHTFLLRRDVTALFYRVYRSVPDTAVTPQDKYRLLMIFAISSITMYREGLSSAHPHGYYLAAARWLDQIPLVGSADAVVNMLLVARFGVYQHIGVSLWDISCFCMRQCIELEYHLTPEGPMPAILEQERRRIFWECYILDRYSSSILGRPFAIADEDIDVPLPVCVGDDVLENLLHDTPLYCIEDALDETNELSVFVFCIRLRLITSRIYSEFFCGPKALSRVCKTVSEHNVSRVGHVRLRLQHYIQQLDQWLASAPMFLQPQSLYEQPDWYAFLMEKDKLTLIRGGMAGTTSKRSTYASSDLLDMCMHSARRVIELFSRMLDKHQITWTRNYFQTILMAGLSIIYCSSRNERLPMETGTAPNTDIVQALGSCARVLHSFIIEMPDFRTFSHIFEELAKQVCKRFDIALPITQVDFDSTANPEPASIMPRTAALGDMLPWTLQVDDPNLDWLFTDEMMRNIEADVNEYAWGNLRDDWLDLNVDNI